VKIGVGKKGKKGGRSGNAMDVVEWEGTPVSCCSLFHMMII
jgi:hypothetical protein